VKRSPTPTPKNDEYDNREINYEAKHQARRRHRGKDLIWRTSMQRQEYNLNQCRSQLDVREAHLRVREHRCDHREVVIRAARMRGTDMRSESGSE
jgi:tRNA(Met) C34 N-acetyltransferase TmcA